jgi:hypothetical protein
LLIFGHASLCVLHSIQYFLLLYISYTLYHKNVGISDCCTNNEKEKIISDETKTSLPGKRVTTSSLKGQCLEIFDPRFFSSNNSPLGHDSRPKAVLHMALYALRKSMLKLPKSDSAVSMRPQKPKFFVRVPL